MKKANYIETVNGYEIHKVNNLDNNVESFTVSKDKFVKFIVLTLEEARTCANNN